MKTIHALLLGAALAMPAFANARPEPAPRTIAVSFNDLDLTHPAGQVTLQRRVVAAIRGACGDADIRDLSGMRAQQRCRTQARLGASAQMQTALLRAGRRVAVGAETALLNVPR